MKQRVIFNNEELQRTHGIHNQLYAWSKRHNIVFVEAHLTDGLAVSFGRQIDLTTFLLTWDERIAKPRVV